MYGFKKDIFKNDKNNKKKRKEKEEGEKRRKKERIKRKNKKEEKKRKKKRGEKRKKKKKKKEKQDDQTETQPSLQALSKTPNSYLFLQVLIQSKNKNDQIIKVKEERESRITILRWL